MYRSAAITGFAFMVAALSACSEKAQDKTEEAGRAIASDVEKTGDRAANAADDVQRDVSAILSNADENVDKAGADIKRATDKAGDEISRAADSAKDKTGRTIENAGRAIQN